MFLSRAAVSRLRSRLFRALPERALCTPAPGGPARTDSGGARSIGSRGRQVHGGGLRWGLKNGAAGMHFHKERGQMERERVEMHWEEYDPEMGGTEGTWA